MYKIITVSILLIALALCYMQNRYLKLENKTMVDKVDILTTKYSNSEQTCNLYQNAIKEIINDSNITKRDANNSIIFNLDRL